MLLLFVNYLLKLLIIIKDEKTNQLKNSIIMYKRKKLNRYRRSLMNISIIIDF